MENNQFIIKSYKGFWHTGGGWLDDPQYATRFTKTDAALEKRIREWFPTVTLSHVNVDGSKIIKKRTVSKKSEK